jgi:hypothetical protein
MNNNIWKSIGAVLAGILVGAVLSIVTDVALHAARVFPPWASLCPTRLCSSQRFIA